MSPSYLSPKVKIRSSPIHKKGLFAKELIKKDEIISIPEGYIIRERQVKNYSKNAKKYFKVLKSYLVKIAPGFYLAPFDVEKLKGDDYLNHSCNPNVGVKGSILFVAMCDIRKDEELTYDYAMTDNDPGVYFKCLCQEKKCRQFVTGEDWKKPVLQKKYKGYFAWHIQEAINKL